jgi:hypothetical protein
MELNMNYPFEWITPAPISEVGWVDLKKATRAIQRAAEDMQDDIDKNVRLYSQSGVTMQGDPKYTRDHKSMCKSILDIKWEDIYHKDSNPKGSYHAYVYQVSGKPAVVAVVAYHRDCAYLADLVGSPFFQGAAYVMFEFILNECPKYNSPCLIKLFPLNEERTRPAYKGMGLEDDPNDKDKVRPHMLLDPNSKKLFKIKWQPVEGGKWQHVCPHEKYLKSLNLW